MNDFRRERVLQQVLEERATRAMAGADVWPRIRARLQERRRASPWRLSLPHRLAGAVLALVMVVLLGGAVYAARPVVQELFWPQVEEAGLSHELNLTQTIDGVTVRLERAYADANVVLLGLTVSGPEERYTFSGRGGLWTAEGARLWGSMGLGTDREGSVGAMGEWRPSEREALVMAYDASAVQGTPSELGLRLETFIREGRGPKVGQDSFIGPFTFNFKVPYFAGQVVNLDKTVTASGVPITLERVVITPAATRAFIRFSPADAGRLGPPLPSAELPSGRTISAGSAVPYRAGNGTLTGDGYVQNFRADLTDEHGEWTLTVKVLARQEPYGQESIAGPPVKVVPQGPPEHESIPGPWVFRFKVP